MHNANPPRLQTELPRFFGVAALCALTFWFGLAYFEDVSVFRLGSGAALAAALIGGRRYVLAAGLGAWTAYIVITGSFWGSLVTATSCALAAWFSAWLIQRDGQFQLHLASVRDISRLFFLGGFVGASLSALVGTGALLVRGAISSDIFWSSTLYWWMGDALGVILLTPVILTWTSAIVRPRTRPSTKKVIEATLMLACTGFVGGILFLNWAHGWVPLVLQPVFKEVTSGYWMLFFIAWTAARLGTRGTSLALLIVAALGIQGVLQGGDIFGNAGEVQAFRYWTFTVIVSLSGMVLAVYIADSTRNRLALARSEAAVTSAPGT